MVGEYQDSALRNHNDSFNLEGSQMDFVNTLPPFSENYKDTKFTKEWARDLITQGVRFGLKFNF